MFVHPLCIFLFNFLCVLLLTKFVSNVHLVYLAKALTLMEFKGEGESVQVIKGNAEFEN